MRAILERLTRWGLICALLAGCADRELAFDGPMLHLVDRLDRAAVEVRTPLPLTGVVDEVVWVRDGLASVVVSLRREDGVGGAARDRVLRRFGLPLLPAPAVERGDLPELLGLPLPRLATPDERPNGFLLQGAQLAVVHGKNQELPEVLRLRYTVYAAQLAGTAVGAGFARRDVFALRSRRGATSSEAIAIPTGTTLSFALPPVAPGRIEGAMRALSAAQDAGGALITVRVQLDGEDLFEEDIPAGDVVVPLGNTERPWIAIDRSNGPRTLSITAEGAPGGLAIFEAPLWSRARSWREGPNVLLLVADGLRSDRMGCFGDKRGLTPHLDDLAGHALGFADFWAESSWSLPSLATLMTGLYSSEHLATRHDRRLGRGVTTLAEVFRGAGYRTAAITDGGFAAPEFGLDRGFLTFDGRGGGTEAVLERAVRHLERFGDRPWFLLVHVADLTPPFQPSAGAAHDVALRHPPEAQKLAAEPAAFLGRDEGQRLTLPEIAWLRDLYDEELKETDARLGAFFEHLDSARLFDDLVLAVTASHGEELGEHGFLGHGDTLYPEVLRVPLLLKLPRNQRGGIINREPTAMVDVAPTLVQGAELKKLLSGTTFGGRSLISGMPPSPAVATREHPVAGRLMAVRRDQYLFIKGRSAYRSGSGNELYQVFADPAALNDVARQSAAVSKVNLNRLEKHLEQHPPRVEGAENTLVAEDLAGLDPLPGAQAAPPEAPGGRGPRPAGGDGERQPRRNR